MRVVGDSMNGACIADQDIVVVDRAITATHNKIVVARLGEDFTLKRLQVINGRKMFLKSENPAYPAIEVPLVLASKSGGASRTSSID